MTEPSSDLAGVRALVTGGTSGLGFAMSQALAEAGAHVVLTGRTEQRVQDAATRIDHGDRVTGLVMDVRAEQSVTAGVESTLADLGGIDVLVNNAGIGMRTVNPHFMTEPIGFWQVSPVPQDSELTWLDPAIMGPPIVWLASPASDGVTDQRIVATEFADQTG